MTVLESAMSYTGRGWRVFPLSPGGRTPWPGWGDWQNPADGRTGAGHASTPQQCVDMFGGSRSIAGVGIVTGAVSGFWVLDVDCKHGKDGRASLAFLIAAHGALPDTYTVETPNGGLHLYFALPRDFEPINAGGRGVVAARLGPGLDVRGRGGYVGAPPSRVAREDGTAAPYQVISAPGVGVAKPPDWLVELIRPPERPEVVAIDPEAALTLAPDLRVRAYLGEALPSLLSELANATPGGRNATAHRVACRLWEWINVGWLDPDQARARYDMAAAACESATGSGFDAPTAWGSGRRTVQGRPASMPDIGFRGAELLPFEAEAPAMRDFSGPGTAAGPADLSTDPVGNARASSTQSNAGDHSALDPAAAFYEYQVGLELTKLRIREDAKRRLRPAGPTADAGHWFTAIKRGDVIETVEPAAPLIAGWLWRNSAARVYGPSGHGKSFVVLDMALCVAAGVPWHGAETSGSGDVVYVAGEGAVGLAARSRAWRVRHGLDELPTRFGLVDEMPTPADPAVWAAFVLAMRVVRPSLVVFDTQAWLQAGLNENDGEDSQTLVDALATLRKATGACVLLVHHTGKNEGAGGRGHSSVKAAMDVEIEVRRDGPKVTTLSRKQKDAADPASVTGMMTEVEGTGSLTLVYPGDAWAVEAVNLPEGVLPLDDGTRGAKAVGDRLARQIVALLRDVAGEGNGITRAELFAEWRSQPANQGQSANTLNSQARRAIARLDQLGRLGSTTSAERFIYREFDDLDDLAAAPDGAGTMGFGRPMADKTEQTKTKTVRRVTKE